MASDDGGPAFPCPSWDGAQRKYGMTLRDYFAGQALAAMDISSSTLAKPYAEHKAARAYEVADAMLKERGRDE